MMRSQSIKSRIYLSLQIIFTILTFVGFILLLIGKIKTAGMSICCMAVSLAFGRFYNSSKDNK
jgi:hypothetical protein